jgi:hypothetical protein
MTGIIMATKGVLLRKALAPAEEGKIFIWAWRIFSGSPTSTLEAIDIAPVAYIPAAIGNKAATVMTPGFEKPANKSFNGARPRVIARVRVPMKTNQVGSWSHTSRANIPTSKPVMSQASVVIGDFSSFHLGFDRFDSIFREK